MAFRDLRDFIAYLKKEGELLTIDEEVDKDVEVPGLMAKWAFEDRPAVLFNNVKSYENPLISNILGSRKRLAMALGIDEKDLVDEYLRRRDTLLPFKVVDDGPVKEVVVKQDIDIKKLLPAPYHHEKDLNPYITSGVLILKDPETGKQSVGIHRNQLLGSNRIAVAIKNPPSATYLAKAEKMGKQLEVAVVIGMEPVTWFSSVIWAPGGHDKLEMAGGLRGEPIELTRCATVDLEVPSTAEVVIEGRIVPGELTIDGPFGEVLGCYKTLEDSRVIEITAVMHRKNFIYQDLMPWSMESDMLMELSYGVEIYKDLKRMLPGIVAFHFLEGTCMLNAAISIKKESEGDVKRALYLALNLNPNVKNVIIVDDDVDIHNMTELSWALATRFQADRGVIVISDVKGSVIDSSSKPNNITSKIGIDATKPLGAAGKKFEKVGIAPEAEEKTRRLLKKLGL